MDRLVGQQGTQIEVQALLDNGDRLERCRRFADQVTWLDGVRHVGGRLVGQPQRHDEQRQETEQTRPPQEGHHDARCRRIPVRHHPGMVVIHPSRPPLYWTVSCT